MKQNMALHCHYSQWCSQDFFNCMDVSGSRTFSSGVTLESDRNFFQSRQHIYLEKFKYSERQSRQQIFCDISRWNQQE